MIGVIFIFLIFFTSFHFTLCVYMQWHNIFLIGRFTLPNKFIEVFQLNIKMESSNTFALSLNNV